MSKLAKALFNKNLVFSRVKLEYYDAPFKRSFTLDSGNGLYSAQMLIENSQRFNDLETGLEYLNRKLFESSNVSSLNLFRLNSTLKNLDDSIGSISARIQDLYLNVYSKQAVDSALTNLQTNVNSKLSNCRYCLQERIRRDQGRTAGLPGTERLSCSAYVSVSNPNGNPVYFNPRHPQEYACIYEPISLKVECG